MKAHRPSEPSQPPVSCTTCFCLSIHSCSPFSAGARILRPKPGALRQLHRSEELRAGRDGAARGEAGRDGAGRLSGCHGSHGQSVLSPSSASGAQRCTEGSFCGTNGCPESCDHHSPQESLARIIRRLEAECRHKGAVLVALMPSAASCAPGSRKALMPGPLGRRASLHAGSAPLHGAQGGREPPGP